MCEGGRGITWSPLLSPGVICFWLAWLSASVMTAILGPCSSELGDAPWPLLALGGCGSHSTVPCHLFVGTQGCHGSWILFGGQ